MRKQKDDYYEYKTNYAQDVQKKNQIYKEEKVREKN